MSENRSGFSRIRSFFWPIYRHELIKFVPMFLFCFLVAFDYELLRILKDALIITAPDAGAEALPFLKVWAILPSAIALTFLFTRAANRFNREHLFYVVTGVFLLFFIIFITILYPHREALYLNSFASHLKQTLPAGLKGFIAIIRYWPLSLFYIMSELWSTMMISILLWGFANDVIKVSEAKRFYALFGIGINISGVFAGIIGEYFAVHLNSHSVPNAFFSFLGAQNSWDESLIIFMGLILICGFLAIGIYRWMNIYIFPDYHRIGNKSYQKDKPKISLMKSINYVAQSPYLLCIVVLVLSYHICINFSEFLWKKQMSSLFPDTSTYTAAMSKVTYYTGIVATFFAYLVSGNTIRTFGWKTAALVTPAIIIATGAFFFYFLFANEYFPNLHLMLWGMSPLALSVLFGSIQNCFSRAAKYTLFDDTKEMTFIPLSSHERLLGKTSIDGVGSRLGKSGSSFILQLLLLFFSNAISASPFIFAIMLAVTLAWIIAIRKLSTQFNVLSAESVAKETATANETVTT